MKLTKTQLRKMIQNETRGLSRLRSRNSNVVDIDINQILMEQREDLEEGIFTQALKTAAINLVPGGRVAADFTRARGFEQLEAAAEKFESQINDLEARVAALESSSRPLMP